MIGRFFKIFGCRSDCLFFIVPPVKVKKSGRMAYARLVRALSSDSFAENVVSDSAKPLGMVLKSLITIRKLIGRI